jgi:tetratricopeptide (TPR) repeat protein
VAGAAVVIGLLLSLASPGSETPPDAELLERAEAAFHEGVQSHDRPAEAQRHFREAAEHYEALRRRGALNAALCRNEGNAYLLAGDLPRAILAYRRGLLLPPDDPALRANLEAARGQVVYPMPDRFGGAPADLRPPWLPRLPSWLVSVLALTLYAVGWVALTRWWMTRRGRLLVAGIAALVVAAAFGTLWAVGEVQAGQEAARPVVVIADDGVLLRRGNGLSYPPRYETPVNRGVEARLLLARGDWVKIELAGGETGWVLRAYVVADE